jgi:hypothetical protein
MRLIVERRSLRYASLRSAPVETTGTRDETGCPPLPSSRAEPLEERRSRETFSRRYAD